MPKEITKGLMYTRICPYVYKYFFLCYFFQFHIRIKKNPLPFKYVEILPGFEFKLGQEKNIFGPSSPEEQHGFAEKTIALEKQVCIRHIWRNHQYFHQRVPINMTIALLRSFAGFASFLLRDKM